MSWSASLEKPGGVEEISALTIPYDLGDAREASDEQLEAAKGAAIALVESGVVGEGPWGVSLYGHGNPGHEPRKGHANDCLTVQLSQAPRS